MSVQWAYGLLVLQIPAVAEDLGIMHIELKDKKDPRG